MDIKIIRAEEMAKVITMKEAIEASKQALKQYSDGGTDIPLRINIDVAASSGNALFMPGYAEAGGALGIKIVSVFPKNADRGLPSVPASMIMLDPKTGMVNAVMDGTFLTKLRTGAVAGAATDILARKDAESFLLIGAGGQAESQLEAVLSVRSIKKCYVAASRFERAEAFAAAMNDKYGAKFGLRIDAVADANSVVSDMDIITAVTTSQKPVFDGKLVKAGAHINGMGSYTPAMVELGEEILLRAGKIFVDTREGVLNEAGDFINPIREGKLKNGKSDIMELGELISEKVAGRVSDEEITVFKSTGTAVLDIVVGKAISDRL